MFKSLGSLSRKLPDVGSSSSPLESLPTPMRRAVRLMLAGAAATAIWGIFIIVVTVVNRNDLISSNGKKITNGELASGIVYSVLITVILTALWVLMARMNQNGRNWARITSTVFFVLWSYESYETISGVGASAPAIIDLILVLAIWAIGLAALNMLFRADSSAFFKSQSAR